MFLQQMTGAFLQFCQAKKLRPKTMSSYEQTLKLFARWLEEEKGIETVEAITEEVIMAYIVELQQRGKYTCYVSDAAKATNYPMRRRDYRQAVSNTTINNDMRNMKVFFTWLVDSEYILQSPMRRIHALPQERKPKEYLEDDEVKLLLKNMDKSYFSEYRDMLIMMIMLDAGTRLGETLSIENDQLNLVDQCVFLPAEKTKGRKARTVFFSAKTAKELRRWLQYKDRYLGSYQQLEKATQVRKEAEKELHHSTVMFYEKWADRAQGDVRWVADNPISISVQRRENGEFELTMLPEMEA